MPDNKLQAEAIKATQNLSDSELAGPVLEQLLQETTLARPDPERFKTLGCSAIAAIVALLSRHGMTPEQIEEQTDKALSALSDQSPKED